MAKSRSAAKAKAPQGSKRILDALNEVKRGEITAILTFMAHTDALRNLGFDSLAAMYQAEAVEEMGHATRLAERIYFLGGTPETMPLAPPDVGEDLHEIIDKDAQMELNQIERIKRAIKLCFAEADTSTRTLLEEIIADEEKHFGELDLLSANLKKYGLPYLAQFAKREES